ncbi:hypothetical protein FB567DRAFT_466545 [Paraphoma chrysanthemicola]|uniref:Uncharacterized protein n=1 Tax=Paraphoma chrysanthemicola TaxID=798071 RepID=A0A8K0RA42_9PLEO|nr:hypothetical protein FB567DRAFT_466545 [Paraphoma chrysanthemicola]
MTDDSANTIPTLGLKTTLRLRDRFCSRLSRLVTAAVDLNEHQNQASMIINLSRREYPDQPRLKLDDELHRFVKIMEHNMPLISRYLTHTDANRDKAKGEIKRAILLYSHSHMEHIVPGIMRIFRACQDAFANFMTLYFGIEDIPDGQSKLDRELADPLISLLQSVQSYDHSVDQLRVLIEKAWNLTIDIQYLQIRLSSLLWKRHFGKGLYPLVCMLSFPEYTYHAFVRAAEACPAFSVLEFNLSPPAPSSRRLQSAKIAKTSASSNSHCSSLAATSGQPVSTADRLVESNSDAEHDDILAAMYPYIGEQQLLAEHTSLCSRSDQDTVHLLAAVLVGSLLRVSSDAWFTFGFVATREQEEERHLGGLYAAILREAQEPQAIFRELKYAHQNDTLTSLFDSKAYGHFRQQFPRLEKFLKTPSVARSTVWRLIQYTKCEVYTEPSPVIKRDFGFQFCRNHQDVTLLKDAYTHILANTDPRDLHNACHFGRLADFARMSGVPDHAKKQHLFGNDYPSPFIGFDNRKGLERHYLPLFKSSKKV